MVNGMCILTHGTYAKIADTGNPQFDQMVDSLAPAWEQLAAALPGMPQAQGAAGAYEHEVRKEAAERLIMNHSAVLRDICNPNDVNVVGKPLSQPSMKRISPQYMAHVDACMREVVRRLLGSTSVPAQQKDQQSAAAWIATCLFLSARLQSVAKEVATRGPDMSEQAGLVLRSVLSEVASLM